jgi:hypothetical protein
MSCEKNIDELDVAYSLTHWLPVFPSMYNNGQLIIYSWASSGDEITVDETRVGSQELGGSRVHIYRLCLSL